MRYGDGIGGLVVLRGLEIMDGMVRGIEVRMRWYEGMFWDRDIGWVEDDRVIVDKEILG